MAVSPDTSLENHAAAADALRADTPALVWRRVIADTETAVGAAVKLIETGRGDFLLESVEGGRSRGRYSMLGLDPDLVFRGMGNKAEINRDWRQTRSAFTDLPGDSLSELRSLVDACRIDVPAALPKALACLVGYFGYETIGLVEKLPRAPQSPLELPDMLFVRPTLVLIFDRLSDEMFVVAPIWPSAQAPEHALNAAQERIDEALRRLAALADRRADDAKAGERFYQEEEPGWDLPDRLRHRLMVRHLVRLWAMVRKGQKVLEEKLEEGETNETDAVVEDLLGHVWELTALKAKGWVRQQVRLLELADERWTDQVRSERIEQGWLLDLDSGQILVERRFRPFAAIDRIKERDSLERPVTISEAGIYPGFVNRRIRWEVAALTSRPAALDDFAAIHRHAQPTLDAALAVYKEQIRNPLAPDDAVVLIAVADLKQAPPVAGATDAGPTLVAIGAKGATLVLRDSQLTRFRSTNNLAMAAGAQLDNGRLKSPAAILVRLYQDLASDAILGQPLALIVGNTHIRLGR